MKSIKHECAACGGTGLYCGFCERKGTAVVCLCCEGKGWVTYEYKEFAGRKKRRGIKTINVSRGGFIATGVGATGEPMTYKQFEERFKP